MPDAGGRRGSTRSKEYQRPIPKHTAGQGAQKKKPKKTDVPTYLLFLRFFEIFRSDFRKYFYGVFGLLMQRNGQKRDKQNRWEKTTGKWFIFLNFFGQKFLTWTFPKKFFIDFLTPLIEKRTKTPWEKMKGKKFFFLNFFGEKFLTWIFPKSFLWCFWTPLVEKRTKTKTP